MKNKLNKIGRKDTPVYKIKYKPLGLYYKKPRINNLETLSEDGTLFNELPDLKDLIHMYYDGDEDILTSPSDWTIEKYTLRLHKTIQLTNFRGDVS